MKHIRRWGVSLVLLAGLLLTPVVSSAETQPYLKSSYMEEMQGQRVHPVVQHKVESPASTKQEFWIVTNEIKSPAKDGIPEMEVYRWDPGFLVVQKGQPVTIHFYGVKGKEHPFVIEGLNVKGDVKKGKVTTVTFTPDKVGTFPIICLTHPTQEKNGPMIGYLKVE